MAKVAVIAKITALPGRRDEVVAILNEVVTATQDEPGTLFYAMNVDKAEDDVIWFYEVYADDAALAAHGGSEAMKAAGGQLRDKAAGRPELHVVELVGGKGLPA
ncbi:MAG: putative quinol monooxygenase [Acidimicrobiales bacterium]